jgi:phage shock protein A
VSLFRRKRATEQAPDDRYDPAPAEAAYRRLLALAQDLRRSTAQLTAAAARVEMRETQLRNAVAEYERIAQQAIAGGRTIQAESAIASSEAAEATLAALKPQADEIAAQHAELERAAAKLEGEAAALRAKLDASQTAQAVSGARARLQETAAAMTGHRHTLDGVVRDAEDEALRLEGRARGLAELYGQPSGEKAEDP